MNELMEEIISRDSEKKNLVDAMKQRFERDENIIFPLEHEEKMQLSVCFGTSKGLLTLGKTAENLRVDDWSAHQPIEIGSCQSSPARS